MGFLYPKTCCFCGKVSENELCDACSKHVVYISEPRCKKCGKPIEDCEKEYCYDCASKTFFYEQGKNIWLHKGAVSWSIYQFKYHNRRIYGEFYAKELCRLYGHLLKEWQVDVIIPVPLHRKKLRKRGYNQAEIVAVHLGKMTGIPVNKDAVVRKKYTKPQKELNHKERRKNLKNAFVVKEYLGHAKNVLIIDDIYTTGSTIDTISEELKKTGVQKVWFFTISIGQGF